jgi:LysM repeat protein
LSGSTIGIKIADGSYYPILEGAYTGKKNLTLTTVKDNQGKVQIDLYRGEGDRLVDAQYIGSLIIENIPPAAKGRPDIELLIGLDAAGELTAEASDAVTGETQTFSISLKTLTEEETYEIPEFEMEGSSMKTVIQPQQTVASSSQTVVSGSGMGRAERGGPRWWLIVLFIVLGVALLGAIGWFVYTRVAGNAGAQPAQTPVAAAPAEPAAAETTPAPAAAEPAQAETAPAAEPPAAATSGDVTQTQSQAGGVAETPKPAAETPAGGVTYLIKRGDTLWDISSTYYRNPWLYPKLAKANKIPNPDLIFAGTTIYIPEQ